MTEFLHHFGELLSDPAHLAFEVFTTLVLEGLILGLFWPFIKRRIRRDVTDVHTVIDAEHGVVHLDAATVVPAATERGARRAVEVYDHQVHGL